MELLPEVDAAVDALFWDRDDAVKRLAALRTLEKAVACEACVEEIRRLGGVDRLRKALAWDDPDAVDLAASVIAACSGSTARPPGARAFRFGNKHEIVVRECDYVEGGLGWRVWASAVVMCRDMLERAEELKIRGADVLEVGAGCGVAGFLAARLGAKSVTFTDYLPGVLANLRASVAINEANAPMNDPDRSSPCAFSVRHLEWLSAVPGLVEKTKRVGGGDGSACAFADAAAAAAAAAADALDPRATFKLILGSDVCYEDPLPLALARTLKARLAPGGLAWLVLPVRDWPGENGMTTIERLRDECVESGLRAVVERAPDLEEHEYDGGTMVKHDGGMVHVWIRA